MHLRFGGPIYTIQCGKQGICFEMHPVCGPIPVSCDTHEPWKNMMHYHRFWDDVQKWIDGGQRVTSFGLCIVDDDDPLNAKRFRMVR